VNQKVSSLNGICRLCEQSAVLQESHVLPAFAFRWLRETSGNGHIRGSIKPNLRVQDGIKRPWLCASCELRFSAAEGMFARALFRPYLDETRESFQHSEWLLQFCVSVSWRVLLHFAKIEDLARFTSENKLAIASAEKVWREYLLGQRKHPGANQQHLLPVNRIEKTTFNGFSPNINRYLMRSIDMDLCQAGDVVITYAKLGRFIIIGFVNETNPQHWEGTKVNANEGIVQPRDYVLPSQLIEYIDYKARRAAESVQKVSDVQHKKIDASFRQSINRLAQSDYFSALEADIERFGDAAFLLPGDRERRKQ
jgi:hypothetical protein